MFYYAATVAENSLRYNLTSSRFDKRKFIDSIVNRAIRLVIALAQKLPKTFVLTSHTIIIDLKDNSPFDFTANKKLAVVHRRLPVDLGHSSCSYAISTYENNCILT